MYKRDNNESVWLWVLVSQIPKKRKKNLFIGLKITEKSPFKTNKKKRRKKKVREKDMSNLTIGLKITEKSLFKILNFRAIDQGPIITI